MLEEALLDSAPGSCKGDKRRDTHLRYFNRGIPLGYYPTNYYPISCDRVSNSHSTRLTKGIEETSRFMNDHR